MSLCHCLIIGHDLFVGVVLGIDSLPGRIKSQDDKGGKESDEK